MSLIGQAAILSSDRKFDSSQCQHNFKEPISTQTTRVPGKRSGLEVIKKIFMLYSTEHKNYHACKHIFKSSIFIKGDKTFHVSLKYFTMHKFQMHAGAINSYCMVCTVVREDDPTLLCILLWSFFSCSHMICWIL